MDIGEEGGEGRSMNWRTANSAKREEKEKA